MDIKQYTDEQYIPISDLSSLGDTFVQSTMQYRQEFMEIVQLDNLEFANIVETPKLVKIRYEKNVELKGKVNIKSKNNDFILQIAKNIVSGKNYYNIDEEIIDSINKKYISNNKDLTVVTSWLVNNIELLSGEEEDDDLIHSMPELSEKDIKFIKGNNSANSHYSISDYLKINKSSYETGRKALERLAELGLYSKNKVGKTFVYKPTKKLRQYMEGGEYGN